MNRAVCLALLTPLLVSASPAPPVWRTDLASGLAAARASGKPLFIVFRCEH